MSKQIFLTAEGLEELKKELEELKTVKRPEIIQALKEARSLGDLSENAEYDAARNEQAVLEDRIKELEITIENVTIISGDDTGKVTIGSTVTIKYVDDDEVETYQIVGSHESDPFNNRISNESPIAKAIIGKKIVKNVMVDSPNGQYEIEILEIK